MLSRSPARFCGDELPRVVFALAPFGTNSPCRARDRYAWTPRQSSRTSGRIRSRAVSSSSGTRYLPVSIFHIPSPGALTRPTPVMERSRESVSRVRRSRAGSVTSSRRRAWSGSGLRVVRVRLRRAGWIPSSAPPGAGPLGASPVASASEPPAGARSPLPEEPPASAGPPTASAGLAPAASSTCFSRALSTFPTCWFTIGCSTRWPIDRPAPRSRRPPPTAWPCRRRLAQVELRVHADDRAHALPLRGQPRVLGLPLLGLLEENESGSAPSPSGTFTRADQWRSSAMSKLSIPGISFAIRSGSFSTSQTTDRGASNDFSPETFTSGSPRETSPRLFSGSRISSQIRWDGLQLSCTTAPPARAARPEWLRTLRGCPRRRPPPSPSRRAA